MTSKSPAAPSIDGITAPPRHTAGRRGTGRLLAATCSSDCSKWDTVQKRLPPHQHLFRLSHAARSLCTAACPISTSSRARPRIGRALCSRAAAAPSPDDIRNMPRVYPPIEGKNTSQTALAPSIVETGAGFTAGVVSTFVVHPFDVVKTRLQVDPNPSSEAGVSFRVFRNLLRDEGFVHGVYRGLAPNLIGNSVSWAFYFLWYSNIKDFLRRQRGSADSRLYSLDYFTASGAAGVLTAVATNPIWVIKTRMLSTPRESPGAYRTVAQGARDLWHAEGISGFYRGLLPSLFGVSHGAVQFMAYEQLKNYRVAQLNGESISDLMANGPSASSVAAKSRISLSNVDYLSLSAISKIFAGTVTYPYQVLRTRLQIYDPLQPTGYWKARDLVRYIYRREGLVGFYRGLGPNILRVLPSTCVTFLVYENTKIYLGQVYTESAV